MQGTLTCRQLRVGSSLSRQHAAVFCRHLTPTVLVRAPAASHRVQQSSHSHHAAAVITAAVQDLDGPSASSLPSSSAAAAADPLQHHVRHQPALPIAERKALRARAETLARERRLARIQVGDKGIHDTFLAAAADMLAKNELLRVNLGAGSDRKEAGTELEAALDCVVVHAVGFTVTLYRKAGLPRPAGIRAAPSSSSSSSQRQQQELELNDGAVGAGVAADAALQGTSRRRSGGVGGSRAKQRGNAKHHQGKQRAGSTAAAPPPPEFHVL